MWKYTIAYLRHIRIYQTHVHRRSSRPIAYLKITQSGSRYPYNLVVLFHKAGYHICLQHYFFFIAELGKYSRWMLELQEFKLCFRKPTKYALLVTDRDQECSIVPGALTVLVNYHYFASKRQHRCYLLVPFMMHPVIYRDSKTYQSIALSRSRKRQMRVLFAGNSSRDAYLEGYHHITTLFKKNFRPDLIAYVRQHLPREEQTTHWPKEKDGVRKFFLLPRVPGKVWLDTLARADFFLSPCGVYMPFSHNIIEAMAVGTIPITEYGELFDPPLVNGKTCLSYRTKTEAVDTVRRALALPTSEIDQLRANVIRYYTSHLQPEMVKKRLERLSCDKVVLPFNIEKNSVDLLVAERHINL